MPGSVVFTYAHFELYLAEHPEAHRANGARSLEMEAAALFALGQARGLPVASTVVIDAVPDNTGPDGHGAVSRTIRGPIPAR